MARYKAPTIAERGGLRLYLESIGVDYGLFKLLRKSKQNNSSIGRALSVDRKKQIKPATVKHWCRVDDQEMEDANNGRG